MERLGYRAAYEHVVREIVPPAEGDVVDIGTGTGDLAAAYCAVFGPPKSVTLVDTAPAMLEVAARALETESAGHVSTVQASLSDMPSDVTYSTVLCAHVIEHLDDPQSAVSDLARLIAPHGCLLLFVSRPHWCQWFVWLRWRHRWYTETAVRQMAEAAGLSCDAVMTPASGPPSRTTLAYLLRSKA